MSDIKVDRLLSELITSARMRELVNGWMVVKWTHR